MKTFAVSMNFKYNLPGNDIIEQNYIKYFKRLGIRTLLIPNATDNPIEYCSHFSIDGVILTGGTDINENIIQIKHTQRKNKCQGRDAVEWQLLEMAVALNQPVLGVCRGMQFINLFFGGDIVLNIYERVNDAIQHVDNDHTVLITNSEFQRILKCDSLPVNSFHNHGITESTIAPNLYEFARCAEDNSVEGIFHPNYPIMGIQWHPERRKKKNDNECQLIKNFLSNGKFWIGN